MRITRFSFGAIRIDGITHEHDVVMEEVKREAEHRNVELLILPAAQAIEALQRDADKTNAILHVTC